MTFSKDNSDTACRSFTSIDIDMLIPKKTHTKMEAFDFSWRHLVIPKFRGTIATVYFLHNKNIFIWESMQQNAHIQHTLLTKQAKFQGPTSSSYNGFINSTRVELCLQSTIYSYPLSCNFPRYPPLRKVAHEYRGPSRSEEAATRGEKFPPPKSLAWAETRSTYPKGSQGVTCISFALQGWQWASGRSPKQQHR